MINLFKFSLAVVTVSLITSCKLAPEVEAEAEREIDISSNLREMAKTPSKPTQEDVIRVKDDIWLGDRSIIEYEGQPLPAHLDSSDGVTLISNRPITLFEIGDMISKVTNVQVRYASQLEKNVIEAAGDNAPTAENMNVGWAEPDKMLVSYKGPLGGLLDEICSRFGLWWKYENNQIYFYRYTTKTFVLYSLPTQQSLNVSVGGKSSGSGDGGQSDLGISNKAELEMWKSIEDSIKSMIDEEARLSIDSASGVISLTATPNDIKKVAKYVNEQNMRLSRQIAISVKVFQVTVKDGDSYGLNLNAAFKDGTSNLGLAGPTLGMADSVADNLTLGTITGNWSVSASMKALSTQGTTSLVTSGTVTTLNNKPAPIQVVRKQKYISQTTRTNSSGDSGYVDFSVETDDIETGFTMSVLPRILEHNRVMMMFNLTLSELISLEKERFGKVEQDENGKMIDEGQYIQNPVIESRGFSQEVTMKSGESLVLSGYEKTQNDIQKTGVGSPSNMLLGGSLEASKDRTILVIILTPIVLESPLTPESRMSM